MSDNSDIEDNIKQSRIDLNIKKKPPRQQTEAQKQNIQKALAARAKKIEERKKAASAASEKKEIDFIKEDPLPVEEIDEIQKIEDINSKVEENAPTLGRPAPILEKKIVKDIKPSEEVKQMKKKLKKIELEELVKERINNALDDYKEYNSQQKEIKRLKKLEQRLEEEKKKDPFRNIKFKTPDGIIF